MKTFEVVTAVVAMICAVGVVWFLMWVTNAVIDGIYFIKTGNLFRKDLKLSIGYSRPTWTQLCEIAYTRDVSQMHAYKIIRALMRDVLTGEEIDDEAGSKRTLLESYIDAYRLSQPFEGLPNDTRLTLDRLRTELGSKSDSLHPLTLHIRELLKINDKVNRRQRIYTSVGCLVGVLGFLFAVYAFLYSVMPAEVAETSQHAISPTLCSVPADGK
ncbi:MULTISPECIES: hypothetical protein [Pseudomonas]|uniref:hypothetical protein n=1 Tax=Pseudomonas TaxID=286 RepID=UPI00387AF995